MTKPSLYHNAQSHLLSMLIGLVTFVKLSIPKKTSLFKQRNTFATVMAHDTTVYLPFLFLFNISFMYRTLVKSPNGDCDINSFLS